MKRKIQGGILKGPKYPGASTGLCSSGQLPIWFLHTEFHAPLLFFLICTLNELQSINSFEILSEHFTLNQEHDDLFSYSK